MRRNFSLAAARRIALITYAVIFVWSARRHGIPVDRSAVMVWILVAFICGSIGKSRSAQWRMVLDWSIIVALYFAYDYSRGTADQLGMPVHFTGPRNLDRILFFGTDPNVWMQKHFYEPGSVRWYDVAGSLIYMTHFIFPVAPLVILWLRNRREWLMYVRRLSLIMSIGVICFILYPAAPPWMAAKNGYTEPLSRITGRGWNHLNMHTVSKVWDRGAAVLNGVAAMPSLHAAFSLFVTIWVVRNQARWIQIASALFPLAMCATLTYFAEHWVVDCIFGWLLVVLAWRICNRWEQRIAANATMNETELQCARYNNPAYEPPSI